VDDVIVGLVPNDSPVWDEYVCSQEGCSVYHCAGWQNAIRKAYGHCSYRFAVLKSPSGGRGSRVITAKPPVGEVIDRGRPSGPVAVLPLVHMSHRFFGNQLVGMPFCDSGGSLGGGRTARRLIIARSLQLAEDLRATTVELRQYAPLDALHGEVGEECPCQGGDLEPSATTGPWKWARLEKGRKVRMLLDLPGSSRVFEQSLRAKLRSQIRKPMKEGLTVRVGGLELLRDFYGVFVENMRDIGSPVHSIRFPHEVLTNYGGAARIFVVYLKDVALAGSVTLGFNEVLSNPWTSSLRRYSRLAPNMLLYWSMLEYACENGYRQFDFGRSTVGEGTYRFKEQWGARPEPLYWYRFTRGDAKPRALDRDSGSMSRAVEIWKRLPLPVTRVLGPRIRRYISL